MQGTLVRRGCWIGIGVVLLCMGAGLRAHWLESVARRAEQVIVAAAHLAHIENLAELDRGVSRAESALREFLASGEPGHRAQLENASRSLERDLQRLAARVAEPVARDALATARTLLAEWRTQIVTPAVERREALGSRANAVHAASPIELLQRDQELRGSLDAMLEGLRKAFEWNDHCRYLTVSIERDIERRANAQRGYLLTGDPSHLRLVAASATSLQAHLEELAEQAPRHAEPVARVRELAQRWWSEVGSVQIEARREADLAPEIADLIALLELPGQAATLRALRAALRGASTAEAVELARVRDWLAEDTRATQAVLAGFGVVVTLFCVFFAGAWLRSGTGAALVPRADREEREILARMDRRLADLHLRQTALRAGHSGRESGADEFAGAGSAAGGIPEDPDPTTGHAAESEAQLNEAPASFVKNQEIYLSMLRWLASQQRTWVVALYLAHGPEKALGCRLAVGLDGRSLDPGAFSHRGLHEEVYRSGTKAVLRGPFELSAERIGRTGGAVTAECVVGWPILHRGRPLGVLVTAHRTSPSDADARCAESVTGLLAARLAGVVGTRLGSLELPALASRPRSPSPEPVREPRPGWHEASEPASTSS